MGMHVCVFLRAPPEQPSSHTQKHEINRVLVLFSVPDGRIFKLPCHSSVELCLMEMNRSSYRYIDFNPYTQRLFSLNHQSIL